MSNVLKCFYSKVRLYTGTNQHVKHHTFFLHKTLEYEKEMLSHFLMSKKCINTVSLSHTFTHTNTHPHTRTNTLTHTPASAPPTRTHTHKEWRRLVRALFEKAKQTDTVL